VYLNISLEIWGLFFDAYFESDLNLFEFDPLARRVRGSFLSLSK
jgi:hypothetical protein